MKRATLLDDPGVVELVQRALEEDVGEGDVTTAALVPDALVARAAVLAREPVVVCGGDVARLVFQSVDPELDVACSVADGETAKRGAPIMTVSGRAGSILTAERTALNFLQRLTGIATLSHAFVKRTARYGTQILDTRKTTPTLRSLEKYAVRCGGGHNHRMGLYDRVMIKDNHRRLWAERGEGGLDAAVAAARRANPGIEVQIEVESVDELRAALKARPDWVLLDNMPPATMLACVELAKGKTRIEASGGITLENVAAVAATGVDAISLGCLTHSAPAADLSLEMLQA